MGYDCSAIGIASFADGSGCVAAGAYSVAMGENCTAGTTADTWNHSTHAFAAGSGCSALGSSSVALGAECSARGDFSIAMGTCSAATSTASIAMGYNCSAGYNDLPHTRPSIIALGQGAFAASSTTAGINNQFVIGIPGVQMDGEVFNPTKCGNTFIIDNSQNVAIGVGGDADASASRVSCPTLVDIPVLDVSGDIRCRNVSSTRGLMLPTLDHVSGVTDGSGFALYKTLDASSSGQMLFGVYDPVGEQVELWHAYTHGGTVGGTVKVHKIGGGSGTAHWTSNNLSGPSGVLSPAWTEEADDAPHAIQLAKTLIKGSDISGLSVGDGNIICDPSCTPGSSNVADYAVAIGKGNRIAIRSADSSRGRHRPRRRMHL